MTPVHAQCAESKGTQAAGGVLALQAHDADLLRYEVENREEMLSYCARFTLLQTPIN